MKKFYFFLYQKKFLIIYIIIGFFSILFELFLRNIFIKFNLNQLIYNYLPIVFGILLAFYFNIRFNFSVPKIYLKRSLLYFFIISIMSFIIQKTVKNLFIIQFLDYNSQRIIFSGVLFLIG